MQILKQCILGDTEQLSPSAYSSYAQAFSSAFSDRFELEGHANGSSSQSCTAHISVLDSQGNLAALTQTVLSPFGAKVVLPGTGVLMNNGLVSFDPRPGMPNSLAPGVRGLSNMCPTLVVDDSGCRYALGGAGGRFIIPAIAQLVSFALDYKIDMEQILQIPRIDVVNADTMLADDRLSEDVVAQLKKVFAVSVGADDVYPTVFSRPNIVCLDTTTCLSAGAAHPKSPSARAVASSKRDL